ncbi:M57 family metalloprotease [Roseivirga sp. BDSF3-8]|uniref:M57 family metalloprotease n=1 Tax=Roseivirga sp. BDSF3-8 TaxID=3241598 RepID=UPI00353210DF
MAFFSCSEEAENVTPYELPQDVLSQIEQAGFSTEGAMSFRDGYLVEGDIYLTGADLQNMSPATTVAAAEQYSTNNLVSTNGSRVITMYAQQGGNGGYSAGMIAGLDEAIRRYNAMNLEISFQRISTNSADITMTRLRKGEERQGILGSAGFPTASGDPYGEIKMSGILESSYGLGTNGIATIIAHEMGHCIGFRHTDFFDRSISCGGSAYNEGASSVGANHIPGTPTGASASAKSWMLSCTDGSDRPFNNDDKTALTYLY